ncbi:MAG: helix-hairpin-helix domain-containing protein [Leptolinea sp.]
MKPPDLKIWQAILLGFIGGAVTLAALFYISLPDKMVPLIILPTATSSPIIVYVTGAVVNPGVLHLAPQSRVQDSITEAGGPLETAALDQINLAAPIVDGQKIYVPIKGELIVQQQSEKTTTPTETTIIHLNTATAKDLDLLPGIGEERAAAIIIEREKRGRFQSIEDLLTVSGISKNLFLQIQPFIMLD